jgi:AraC-like DNA-binding protein
MLQYHHTAKVSKHWIARKPYWTGRKQSRQIEQILMFAAPRIASTLQPLRIDEPAMTHAPNDFSVFRFSLEDFPARDRDAAFREIYGRTILRLELEPLPDIPFTMDVELRALPDFGMASGTCAPVKCRRTPQLIDSDDLILVAALDGGGVFHSRGGEAEIGGGQAMLTSAADTGTFNVHSASRVINFRLAFNRIAPLVADLNAALMRPIPRNTEALRLLLNYAGSLQSDLALASPALQHLAVTHMHDLAALAVGATREAAAIAHGRGLRAARLEAIKADVVKHLNQRNLSASTIAARHGVTPRYVSMLFESETETFSEYVLRQRLIRAHRLLTDPRFAGSTVSSIAYDVGFGDVSYFNRVFRRLYGATPSDVREAAWRENKG